MRKTEQMGRSVGAKAWLLTVVAAVVGGVAFAAPVQAGPADDAAGSTRTAGPTKAGKPSVSAMCSTPRNKTEAACFALRRDDIVGQRGLLTLDDPSGYGPADLQSAYNLPAAGGSGQTVAIVDAFDNPNAEADLAVYRQQYGLPPCTTANGCFRKVDQRGGTDYPEPDAGWAGEISLDVDMVSAACPGCKILLVEGDTNGFDDLGAAVNQAVAMGAKYVSNSYGTGYSSSPGSGEDSSLLPLEQQYYNHPGVAVVASSGDDDYGVSFPAASQYVTAVGGTSLVTDGSTRGWSESVWHNQYGGPGSGCSIVFDKPSFQGSETGCDMRAESDVAAVADPATGVAVYNTYQADGWAQYGGTSASSPIIASVYALSGTPVDGTYPNAYPYANPGALNDVTTGLNGTCTPAVWCTAGAGWDGPTGLGTPNGTAAFSTGPHGDIAGTVTDSGSGDPIAGAAVSAGDVSGTSDAAGHYDLSVPVGTYDVTAAAYGYGSKTTSGVAVANDQTVTEDFALAAVPRSTVSGAVTDGSGHAWPIYAKITVDGVPGGPVFTDPTNGRFSMELPQGATYQLHVTANYPGYQQVDTAITVGTGDVTKNLAMIVDPAGCTAPGYRIQLEGSSEPFDTENTPAGWTVKNNTADGGWTFTDNSDRGNRTGGSGGFAIVDSDDLGTGKTEDTELITPALDMSARTAPSVGFDTDYRGFSNSVADVDLTTDGTTWTNLWHQTSASVTGPAHVDLPLTGAAGKTGVQVRFHYKGSFAWWWELDNIFIGDRTCVPTHGGLVLGQVTDANTNAGVVGATVTSKDNPSENATTTATPDDPNLGDGFWWMFSSATGNHQFAAAKGKYTGQTKTVNVATDYATSANFKLKAGRLSVTPATIAKTVNWGGTATQTVTVKNTGTAPAKLTIGEQPGGFEQQLAGAPLNRVHGTFTPGRMKAGGPTVRPAANPSAAPWTAIGNYPVPVQDNAADAYDGKVYSGFGWTGSADTSDLYSYDPEAGSWTKLASAADTREAPAHGFIGGKWYVAGGWGADANPDSKVEIYDPASNSWSTGADSPAPYAGSGSAVLGGKLYVVGGCTDECGSTDVYAYDAGANTWSQVADYPEPVSWEACGGLAGQVICAGGTATDTLTHGYAYDPGTDSWSAIADLPIDLWAGGYAAANGQLVVSGGVTAASTAVTNQGFAYDPASNAWTALPNSNNTVYRAGSALGFYKVGGNPGGATSPPQPDSEVLPGYDQGGTTDVTWLSENPTELTLNQGQSATVTVTLNAGVAEVTQPGAYHAALALQSDTPYSLGQIDVTMTVKPPKSWGKIMGTVTGPGGTPLAGVTVQINSWATSYTLKTAADGTYALWLDVRNNPLQLIVAKDGYQPQVKTVKVVKGNSVVTDFSLKKS